MEKFITAQADSSEEEVETSTTGSSETGNVNASKYQLNECAMMLTEMIGPFLSKLIELNQCFDQKSCII